MLLADVVMRAVQVIIRLRWVSAVRLQQAQHAVRHRRWSSGTCSVLTELC